MRKRNLVVLGILLLTLSACGKQESKKVNDNTKNTKKEQETQISDTKQSDHLFENVSEKPAKDENGIKANPESSMAGGEETIRPDQPTQTSSATNAKEEQELTYEQMIRRFYQKFYGSGGDTGFPEYDVMEILTGERAKVNLSNKYDSDMNYYWEAILGVTDVSPAIDPLFFTDMKYYTIQDFENLPPTVIHIAKNEIYAKHGYIFKDQDLNKYFLGCAWYQPRVTSDQFDDSVFNQYERANLKILSELDQ